MTETTASPPSEHPTTPLFVRPREGRFFAGVCAGVAQRWHLDVTLVRIATVVLALLSGVGFVLYLAAWLLTPSVDGPAPLEPGSPLAQRVSAGGSRLRGRWPTIVLIVVAALLATSLLHHLWFGWFGPPVGLIVVVTLVALAVGTRRGRWVALVAVALIAVLTATVGIFGGHFGSRSVQVASVDDLHASYDYGAGSVRLDLSAIGPVTGEHQTSVHLGRGQVTVVVPPDVPTVVHARAGLGSVRVDGHRVSGIDAEQTLPVGPGAVTSADKLVIDVTVGVGSVTVR